jgi:hypothetical protein
VSATVMAGAFVSIGMRPWSVDAPCRPLRHQQWRPGAVQFVMSASPT